MKRKKLVFLAIISGFITTMLFYMFLTKGTEATGEPPVPMVKAVQAAQGMKKNEKITEENITTVEVPQDQLHPEAVQDPQTIIGKYISADLKQGEIIMQHRIQHTEEETKVVSRKIKEGYRAVSISVDYVKTVSNLIVPGDFVDVVLIEQASESAPEPIDTELVLEKVEVLSVGKQMAEKEAASEDTEEGAEPDYLAVTLELNQYDAIKLINASARGSLQLILNSRLSAHGNEPSEDTVEGASQKGPNKAQLLYVSKRATVHEKPSTHAHAITAAEEGAELIFLGDRRRDEADGLWFRVVTADRKQGWISSQFVKQKGE